MWKGLTLSLSLFIGRARGRERERRGVWLLGGLVFPECQTRLCEGVELGLALYKEREKEGERGGGAVAWGGGVPCVPEPAVWGVWLVVAFSYISGGPFIQRCVYRCVFVYVQRG